jgi:hypothetical protein
VGDCKSAGQRLNGCGQNPARVEVRASGEVCAPGKFWICIDKSEKREERSPFRRQTCSWPDVGRAADNRTIRKIWLILPDLISLHSFREKPVKRFSLNAALVNRLRRLPFTEE